MKPGLKLAVEGFLGLHWDLSKIKPYRTKRDARDEAMRMVGFTQAQEQLRHILSQSSSATALQLAETPHPAKALRPLKIGGRTQGWVPPELPTRR